MKRAISRILAKHDPMGFGDEIGPGAYADLSKDIEFWLSWSPNRDRVLDVVFNVFDAGFNFSYSLEGKLRRLRRRITGPKSSFKVIAKEIETIVKGKR